MLVDKINAYLSTEGKAIETNLLNDVGALAENAFTRQFGVKEDRPGTIRLSSIGRCLRQQAYNLLEFPPNGKEIDSRAKMVFFMGDLTEMAVLALAKAAGCPITETGLEQRSVEIDGVKGHPDALYEVEGKKYLVEVKSMSSYNFKDFEAGQVDEGYRYQINAYLEALGLSTCIVIALNKDAGVLAEQLVMKDPEIVKNIRERIDTLKRATKEDLPYRPYGPDSKGFLPWNCLYCAHWKTCWPKGDRVLIGSKYKLKAEV